MSADILDVIADRFVTLGLDRPKAEVRRELQAVARRLREIMDRYTRIGSPNDVAPPSFVLDSVGRVDDDYVAKVSIEGRVDAATIRYSTQDNKLTVLDR